MAYRFSPDEAVPDAVRRCAVERLDHAIEALRDPEEPGVAVHDARKDVKKVRSLLRLVRADVPKAVRGEQDALRAAARLLADTRAADALAQTVDALAERDVGRLPHHTFDALREWARGDGHDADDLALAPAADALADVRARVEAWPLDRCGWGTVVAGVDRSYRRGQAAFAAADGLDPELAHAWRKRVKDLWYHERLLRDAWPEVLKAQAKESHRLTELLGDDHDLAVLRAALLRGAPAVPELDDVLTLVDLRRRELHADAVALGRRVYAERPKAHRRRTRRYIRAARAETRASAVA